MKNIKYIMGLFLLLGLLSSCEKVNYEFGDLIAPSNIVVTTMITGQDEANPYGDGSGAVTFTTMANNAISYKYVYDGNEIMAPTGVQTYNFGITGIHKYLVTVVAIGTGGITSSTSIEVEIEVLYSPPADLLTMLTNNSSRSWKINAAADANMSLYSPEGAFWWAAGPNEKDGLGLYDDVYTFNVNGEYHDETNGDVLGKTFALDADFGDLGGVRQSWGDTENFPLPSYTESWSLSAPGGVETLSFTGLGFIGTYVATHTYEIVSRSSNEMVLRTFDSVTGGWWHFKLIAIEQ